MVLVVFVLDQQPDTRTKAVDDDVDIVVEMTEDHGGAVQDVEDVGGVGFVELIDDLVLAGTAHAHAHAHYASQRSGERDQ